MLIIPDTNFLIYSVKFRLWHELEKLYPRYSLMIIPEVAYELENLSKRAGGKDKESALLALELIQNIRTKPRKGYADRVILQTACLLKDAGEKNFAVATMDRELSQKLKKAGIKIISVRQKKLLVSSN